MDKRHSKRGDTLTDRGSDGFTLVELLVVLAIIGLLSAIVAPQVLGYLGTAKVDAARAQMRNLESALELFYLGGGRYPTTSEGLDILVNRPADEADWSGPYIKQKSALVDPWGKPYDYKGPEGNSPYVIMSYGRDGKPGGEGLDSDIAP